MPWNKLRNHEMAKQPDDAILVYIHQSDKHPDSQEYTALLDVRFEEDAVRLSTLFNDTRERSASMFELEYTPLHRGLHSRHTRFRDAAWYLLPLDFLRRAAYRAVEGDESGELYLRAKLRLDFVEDVSRFRTISPHSTPNRFPPNFFTPLLCPISYPHPDAALLTVVDCGHANWNEIRTG